MCLDICDVIVLLLLMNPQKSLLCIGKGGDPRHMEKVGEFWGAGGTCCSSAKGPEYV